MSPSGLAEGWRGRLIIILSLAKQKFVEVNERDVKMAVATFSSYNILLYVYNFNRALPSAVLASLSQQTRGQPCVFLFRLVKLLS